MTCTMRGRYRRSGRCTGRDMGIKAVGFDLGETLVHYGDAPLNWKSLYEDALCQVGAACGIEPTSAQVQSAAAILEEYNTRIHPRTAEVAAGVIFARVLAGWGLPTERHL